MAGSGKGRGRAAFTFNIEAIGFSKGETLPEVAFKPPPLFPSTGFKPVPLKMGEEEDYMLALKQEFRGSMKNTPYFMPSKDEKQDWRRLPREMKPRIKTKKGGKTKKAKVATPKSNVDLLKKIEELEKKGDEEKSDEEKEKEKDKEGGEEEGEEEEANEQEYDEEEHEEENDYIASYFEDGDDFGAGSDDNMDEATY
nr:DNA-directed RNA polymerase III subunit RPC7 isoform X4 [Pelodiscus sinensis]|eukprot:XP_025045094.1 DNA-directed RNA polymerase III subunit RPC7 isoform X4 [Pelodiscus sinensis]